MQSMLAQAMRYVNSTPALGPEQHGAPQHGAQQRFKAVAEAWDFEDDPTHSGDTPTLRRPPRGGGAGARAHMHGGGEEEGERKEGENGKAEEATSGGDDSTVGDSSNNQGFNGRPRKLPADAELALYDGGLEGDGVGGGGGGGGCGGGGGRGGYGAVGAVGDVSGDCGSAAATGSATAVGQRADDERAVASAAGLDSMGAPDRGAMTPGDRSSRFRNRGKERARNKAKQPREAGAGGRGRSSGAAAGSSGPLANPAKKSLPAAEGAVTRGEETSLPLPGAPHPPYVETAIDSLEAKMGVDLDGDGAVGAAGRRRRGSTEQHAAAGGTTCDTRSPRGAEGSAVASLRTSWEQKGEARPSEPQQHMTSPVGRWMNTRQEHSPPSAEVERARAWLKDQTQLPSNDAASAADALGSPLPTPVQLDRARAWLREQVASPSPPPAVRLQLAQLTSPGREHAREASVMKLSQLTSPHMGVALLPQRVSPASPAAGAAMAGAAMAGTSPARSGGRLSSTPKSQRSKGGRKQTPPSKQSPPPVVPPLVVPSPRARAELGQDYSPSVAAHGSSAAHPAAHPWRQLRLDPEDFDRAGKLPQSFKLGPFAFPHRKCPDFDPSFVQTRMATAG